ncbi:hypothetical protein PV797_03455 [Clostridiaceae bacterium M8S5]|nr:hypothetical protein PV797_03455 [Clostridiaceae bacterium M8S5]
MKKLKKSIRKSELTVIANHCPCGCSGGYMISYVESNIPSL